MEVIWEDEEEEPAVNWVDDDDEPEQKNPPPAIVEWDEDDSDEARAIEEVAQTVRQVTKQTSHSTPENIHQCESPTNPVWKFPAPAPTCHFVSWREAQDLLFESGHYTTRELTLDVEHAQEIKKYDPPCARGKDCFTMKPVFRMAEDSRLNTPFVLKAASWSQSKWCFLCHCWDLMVLMVRMTTSLASRLKEIPPQPFYCIDGPEEFRADSLLTPHPQNNGLVAPVMCICCDKMVVCVDPETKRRYIDISLLCAAPVSIAPPLGSFPCVVQGATKN